MPLVEPILDGPADDPAAREKWLGEEGRRVVAEAQDVLRTVQPFEPPAIEAALDQVVAARGARKRDVFQALRVAVTGRTVSPGLPETLAVLGRDEALARTGAALRS